jgi:lipopolysaccharide transport system ATP-binding protein
MAEPVVQVRQLGKCYRVWTQSRPTNLKERVRVALGSTRQNAQPARRDIWALRNATFDVERGEVMGLIGPNGAGKSTLLAILARITEPTEGEARLAGRVSSLLEVGTGFHPELSGRDNVFLNGAVLGMSRAETGRKYDEIVDFSGVRDFIDMPVKRYSTGMYVRLAFAIAAHLDPEILLLDEVLAVGDQAFQQKCLARIEEMTQSGRTVVFVSHDVNSVARLCRRAVVVRGGEVDYIGDVNTAIEHYLGDRQVVHGGGRLDLVARDGNGTLRFLEARVTGDDGAAVVSGGALELALVFAAPSPVPTEHVDIHATIASSGTGPLVTLSTGFDADRPLAGAMIENGTTLTCRIDDLPLKAGHYYLSLSVDRLGELWDRVTNVLEFSVLPSDFFGGGVLPSEHQSPILVRHRWTLGSPSGAPVGR